MILITGATGLLGSHLAFNLVSSGKKVRAIKRPNTDVRVTQKTFQYYSSEAEQLFKEIEWIAGDVVDICSLQEAMADIEEVYHCAAMVSFLPSDREQMMKINVEGTANVVNVALEKGIKKLCHVSSVAALGRAKLDKPVNEQTVWENSSQNSWYAVSKYCAEREVMRGLAEGLDTTIINPSIIIGPGDWGKSSTSLFKMIWNGLKYYSKGVNAYVDVRDVVNIMIQLMEKSISNDRFIVFSNHCSYEDFFNLVAMELGKPKPYIHATAFMGEMAWRMEKLKSFINGSKPFITKETARTANQKVYYENHKIKDVLAYNFISVEQSVKDTARHFLNDHLTKG
jgi:nucleoside-diphosphate-sugar epimerase